MSVIQLKSERLLSKPYISISARVRAKTFFCESPTPFGSPVLPDVNSIRCEIENSKFNLNDIIYTLNTGRDDFKFRAAVYFTNKEELLAKLENVTAFSSDDDSEKKADVNNIPDETAEMIKDAENNAQIAEILINNGYSFDFRSYYSSSQFHKVPVVSYQFDKVYNWPLEKQVYSVQTTAEEEVKEQSADVSDIQEQIKKIWQEILETEEDIDVNETFFELGGNSMLASVLIEGINDIYNCEMQLMDIYSYNTIAEMSEFVKESIK